MRNKDNEVGVIFRNTDREGREYLCIKLDGDALLRLTGGVIDNITINAYEVRSDHPKAPAYSLKYYPPRDSGPARPVQVGEHTPMPRPRAQRTQEPPPPDDGDDVPW